MDWFAAGLARDGDDAKTTRLADLADAASTCALDETIGSVRARLGSAFDEPVVVVTERAIVLGLLRPETLGLDAAQPVVELMQEGPSTYRPNVSATEMAGQLDQKPLARILVTTCDGELVGWVDPERVRRAASEASGGDG